MYTGGSMMDEGAREFALLAFGFQVGSCFKIGSTSSLAGSRARWKLSASRLFRVGQALASARKALEHQNTAYRIHAPST